ncbi:MAG: hypothetical protein AB1847_17595 [bacterium]
MSVKTYTPAKVSVIIGGSIIKSWDTVKVGRDNDRWNFSEGTSGEVTRTQNASLLGAIVLTLPQASKDNATLSAFEMAGTLIPCLIVDKSGASVATMPEGTVVKVPDSEFGKEATQREWTIKGEVIDPFVVGGNN